MREDIYYCQPVFRPPSEANSLLIQVTEGCGYKCDFCMSNLRKKFLIRDIKEIKRDLEIAARRSWGNNVRKIFFLDGNAMVTPFEKLLEITTYAKEIFPNLERCGVYAHAKDILKKSDQQLKTLAKAGLKIAYVGFESGYDDLLIKVNKRATKQDYIEAAKKLMNAEITLSATFINGLGGNNKEISEKHAIESADLINKVCPNDDRIWYIAFLTLMIPPGTQIFQEKVAGKFQEMNPLEILEELKIVIKNISFENKNANCVFRSNHASNYLPLRGILEKDKQKILDVINYGLTHHEILKPELFRAL